MLTLCVCVRARSHCVCVCVKGEEGDYRRGCGGKNNRTKSLGGFVGVIEGGGDVWGGGGQQHFALPPGPCWNRSSWC